MVWFTWNHPERLTEAHLSARLVSLTKNGRAMWASKPADFLFLRKLLHNPWDLIVNVKTLAFHSECLLFIYFQVIVKHSYLNNHLFGHCTLHVRRKKHHVPCAGPEKILQSQAPGCGLLSMSFYCYCSGNTWKLNDLFVEASIARKPTTRPKLEIINILRDTK